MTTSTVTGTTGTSSLLQDPSLQLQKPVQKTGNELNQDVFLQLMIEQFRNQNPLNPQDPSQYLSQLAQFSSVQGITQINQSISALTDAMYANQTLQASGIVGRDVLTAGNSVTLAENGSITAAVNLPVSTATGFVQVVSASGQLVRELPLGSRNAGIANFTWDGKTSTGSAAPAGNYFIQAGYRDGNQATAADTLVATRVISVALGGDGKQAEITTADGQKLALSDIKAIF